MTVPTEWSDPGLAPVRTSQLCTPVAPFQLAYTSVLEPPVDAITSGLRTGRPCHGSR